MTTTKTERSGSWAELLGRRYAPIAAVLAGGVLLEASNVYLTTSLLPTIVEEIGGAEFYAWTMTTFLVASVISSMLVSRMLTRYGAVGAYLIAFALFAAGSVLCALSPAMSMLLAGRTVQGLGGGLLAGLGYALIQRALPERLWARAAALVSAMWGVGNIVGPVVGGLFAELGAWRMTFLVLAIASGVLSLLVVRRMPRTERSRSTERVPVASLALVAAGVAAVSLASVVPAGIATAVMMVVGVLLGVWFVRHERTARSSILPRVTFQRSSALRWVYVSVAILAFGIGTEAFLPLFGQRIGALSPLLAGLLGAALSLGWSITQVVAAGAERAKARRRLIALGPLVLAIGLAAYGFLQQQDPGLAVIVLWFVVLFIGGAGIGLGFPHLTVAALGSTSDEVEGAKAASGINTVLLIGSAFSTAVAGVLVNLGGSSLIDSAQLLMFVFAAVAVVGVLPGWRAGRAVT